jgi:hypothetical protein
MHKLYIMVSYWALVSQAHTVHYSPVSGPWYHRHTVHYSPRIWALVSHAHTVHYSPVSGPWYYRHTLYIIVLYLGPGITGTHCTL